MSNFKIVSVNVSGLLPGETYNYFFTGKGGNWPATLSVTSGSIASCCTDSVETLQTAVNFCATTGSCYGNANLLPYNVTQCGKNVTDIYSLLNLIVKEQNTNDVVLRKDFSVKCDNCLPVLTAVVTPAKTLLTTTNKQEISVLITGLQNQSSYSYRFYGVDGNWPLMLSNVSGIIKPSSNSFTVTSDVIFCETPEICTPADNILFSDASCINKKDLSAKLYLEVVPLSCSGESVRSNHITLACDNCLPIPIVTTVAPITLTSSNSADITFNIGNLRKYTDYKYQIHKVDGNWPVRLSSISGVFTPNSTIFQLAQKITFCDTPTSCGVSNNNVISADDTCLSKDKLFSRLYVSVTPLDCDTEETVSNHFSINCDNCLPAIGVTLPSDTEITSDNTHTITSSISGLVVGNSYRYNYQSSSSNWPVIVEPISGMFTAVSSTKNLSSKITFAHPSGDAIGLDGLLDYSINNVNKTYDPYVSMNLLVESLDCDQTEKTSSNDFMLTCNGCLPCLSCVDVQFSGYPSISLATGCCSGTKLTYVSVTGAAPYEAYKYSLSGIGSTASFNPATGLIYFAEGGSGIIQTLMTTNLINNQKTIVDVTLTHVSTNNSNKSTLGIVCGTGC